MTAKEPIMERNSNQGRHGGNRGSAETRDDKNPNKTAARNTDVESLARDRNVDRAGGRKHGDR
jgi:hypothetical protein